ncbi:MAG: hypothetical protein V1753_00945 [Pseudomonadota bacterium]
MSKKPSAAQRAYYATVLVPMWRGMLDEFDRVARDYRSHILALECLRVAKGPGVDPIKITEFCKAWEMPLTMPVIGPTTWIRRFGKAVGGWPSAGAVFDITGALSKGVKIMAEIGPLLGKLQMNNAKLYALDEKVVPKSDQVEVLRILELSVSPDVLFKRAKDSKDRLESKWQEISQTAEKMEEIRKELGLPEDQL